MRVRTRLAIALGAWALWRLLGPEVSPRHRGVQQRPPEMPGRTVRVGRAEFFVRETGPQGAPPVVLLHGWAYDGEVTWHKVVPLLAERHRVHVVDLRGHGKTDRTRGRFEIVDMADEVAGVLAQLGLGGVPLVGYSMGGMVAQALVRRHPTLVSRLVLGATAAQPVRWPRWFAVAGLHVGRALARFDRITLPRIMHRYLISTGAVDREHSAWLWDELLDRDVEVYYQAGFAIARFDGREMMSAITMPTLCLIPTDDQLIPPDRQHAMAADLADVRVEEIVGARHEALLTHPEVVAKAIGAFID